MRAVPIPSQIIVTRELDPEVHTWLKALSEKLDEKDIRNFLAYTKQLTGKDEKGMADSVSGVRVNTNKQIIKKFIGDEAMCNALMEIMEPKIKEIRKESRFQGIIEALRDLKHSDSEIKSILIKQYKLPLFFI